MSASMSADGGRRARSRMQVAPGAFLYDGLGGFVAVIIIVNGIRLF